MCNIERIRGSSETLTMNHGDFYRRIQEERWIYIMTPALLISLYTRSAIDQAIPAIDKGKGCKLIQYSL